MTTIRHQAVAAFRPGCPHDGYYNDLSGFSRRHHSSLPTATNPVTVAQIGLGAWQLARHAPRWATVIEQAADWLTAHMDSAGLLPYHFPMAHTYRLAPPWCSAMAQGQAASLLVRAAHTVGRDDFGHAAASAVRCLTEPDSALVVTTAEGPVLQEYPADPAPHVLNGWIFGLWGLYDVARAGPGYATAVATAAFDQGIAALVGRLPRYEMAGGWSRYDLRTEGPVNVASPFYHHLHIQQLLALSRLVDKPVFARTAARWQRALRDPVTVVRAVVGKIRFRRHYPRGARS